jgi:hypothetical protein
LSCVGWYTWWKWWVIFQVIGFISTQVTHSLLVKFIHSKYHTEIKSSNYTWNLPMLTSCPLLNWIRFSYKSHCHYRSTLLIWNWTVLNITKVALYGRTDHVQKTRSCCCIRNITQRTSHVTLSQYCYSVTSLRLRGSEFTGSESREMLHDSAVT